MADTLDSTGKYVPKDLQITSQPDSVDKNKFKIVIDNLKIDKKLIEKTILINKSYFLLESIKLTNIKKCIVYLKTIKELEQFVKILKTMKI